MEKEINEIAVSQLMRGERPDGMSFEEFKIKRRAIKTFFKKRSKGRMFYLPKEVDYIENENKEKQKVIKSYGPYRKS